MQGSWSRLFNSQALGSLWIKLSAKRMNCKWSSRLLCHFFDPFQSAKILTTLHFLTYQSFWNDLRWRTSSQPVWFLSLRICWNELSFFFFFCPIEFQFQIIYTELFGFLFFNNDRHKAALQKCGSRFQYVILVENFFGDALKGTETPCGTGKPSLSDITQYQT